MEQTQKKIEMSKPEDQRMSVGDAIDCYIDNLVGVISPSTVRRYQSDRKKFFKAIMPVKLHDLTQAQVQQAVSLDSKRFAPKSIHCAHGLLSAALAFTCPTFTLKSIFRKSRIRMSLFLKTAISSDCWSVLKVRAWKELSFWALAAEYVVPKSAD